ncbi:MAG TPA: isochorismate synthase, partial [Pirellulaceae bacterium]
SDPWNEFGPAKFWLPRCEYDGRTLTVNVVDAHDLSPAIAALGDLEWQATANRVSLPDTIGRSEVPTLNRWRELVQEALALFEREILEKIVLVRRCRLSMSEAVDPLRIVQYLRSIPQAAYHFCFELGTGVAFLGASPECLFRRVGQQLDTEVIAGTRGRGGDRVEDAALSAELLASTKDQLEHDIVRKSICQRLHRCVDDLKVAAKAEVLRLSSTQHLISRIEARLKAGVGDADLIDRLHPTPALGGYPTENALEEIARLEHFNRGWYGAPVGWVGADGAEFAVGIRSALVHGSLVDLYSGAGIVPGSRPDWEWNELEQKILDLARFLAAPHEMYELR